MLSFKESTVKFFLMSVNLHNSGVPDLKLIHLRRWTDFRLTWVNPIYNGLTRPSEHWQFFTAQPQNCETLATKLCLCYPPTLFGLFLVFQVPSSWIGQPLPHHGPARFPAPITPHWTCQLFSFLCLPPSQVTYLGQPALLLAVANTYMCCSQFRLGGLRQAA